MADYNYLTDGRPDGAMIGANGSEKFAFHGSTPCTQAAAITTVVSGTAATTATYGVPTPDAVAVIAALNAVIVALRNKGLIDT